MPRCVGLPRKGKDAPAFFHCVTSGAAGHATHQYPQAKPSPPKPTNMSAPPVSCTASRSVMPSPTITTYTHAGQADRHSRAWAMQWWQACSRQNPTLPFRHPDCSAAQHSTGAHSLVREQLSQAGDGERLAALVPRGLPQIKPDQLRRHACRHGRDVAGWNELGSMLEVKR